MKVKDLIQKGLFEELKKYIKTQIKIPETFNIEEFPNTLILTFGKSNHRNRLVLTLVKDPYCSTSYLTTALILEIYSIFESMIDFQAQENSSLFKINYWSLSDIKPFKRDLREGSYKEIIDIANDYINAFIKTFNKQDELISQFFIHANIINEPLSFESFRVSKFGDYQSFKIAIKDNKVFLDDIFGNNSTSVTNAIEYIAHDVFSSILKGNFSPDEIEWYEIYPYKPRILISRIFLNPLFNRKKLFFKEFVGFSSPEFQTIATFDSKQANSIWKEVVLGNFS